MVILLFFCRSACFFTSHVQSLIFLSPRAVPAGNSTVNRRTAESYFMYFFLHISSLQMTELCRLHSSSGLSNQPKVTMSIHQYALTVLPRYSGLLSNLLRTQSRRSVHLCASLSQKVSKKDRVKQVNNN